jgi:hypothetical protein
MSTTAPFVIRPVAEPRVFDNVYSDDQYARMVDVIRRKGPWKMVLAQHFKSAEEVVATMSGEMPKGVEPSFDMFLTPNFRGYFGLNGVSHFPELEDIFYNSDSLARVRDYWNAEYASPDSMNFIIQGSSRNTDPAHLDGNAFRGINGRNTPLWLLNTMGKSGLFQDWMIKKAQVIAWFYQGTIGGGFTYWPEGPRAAPKRIAAPAWNRGVVTQNEMMYHRGEACGPLSKRMPEGLAFESLWSADPDVADGWRITTDDRVIERVSAEETRLMLHWTANVYTDMNEMKTILEHKDDLTHEQVYDMFAADLRERGVAFSVPSNFLADREFIRLLTRVYDSGSAVNISA